MTDREPGNLLLDQQICFALYNASRALTSRYRDLLAPLGVTYPQYLVLVVLWEEGTTTVTELGARVHLDSGTLSPLLRRLVTAGLITKSRRASDERVIEIGLTDSGSLLRFEAAGIPDAICASTGLDIAAIHSLTTQVSQLADTVRTTRPDASLTT
jgi:DNA-binding MarR family transcriptional regulator